MSPLEHAIHRLFPERAGELISQIKANEDEPGYGWNQIKPASIALNCAFYWRESPEGFDYWNDVYRVLKEDEKQLEFEFMEGQTCQEL